MYQTQWKMQPNGHRELEHRSREPQVDASGAIVGFGPWSEWTRVPTVVDEGTMQGGEPQHGDP